MPTHRGFSSFSGILMGGSDHYYYDIGNPAYNIPPAYAFYKNEEPDFSVEGQYSAVRTE